MHDEQSSVPSDARAVSGRFGFRPWRRDRRQPEPDGVLAPGRFGFGRRPQVDLFLISFAVLFLELACIRWFASTVIFLTFFTNLVLLASFLGMSVGCLAASRRRDYITSVIPLTLVAVILSAGTFWVYSTFGKILIDVGGQGSPQQIYFGTEFNSRDPSAWIIPIEVLAGVYFVLIALIFVGLGQVMGRTFGAIPDRVAAYTTNILGSLAGIAAFGLASYLRTPPVAWFFIGLGLCLYFVPRWTPVQILGSLALLVAVSTLAYWQGTSAQVMWSPYYKIAYLPRNGVICTNNMGHQGMLNVWESGSAYTLPHLLNRDAGGKPFEHVMIIGAGSGNDLHTALDMGARSISAVEIDPVIQGIGAANHPRLPYSDPRVKLHLDDGRSYVRKTKNRYDLIVYALVDSLVLHSGYSSLRLESFLFTEEAFRDIKAKLKPGGVFAMYNYYRQGWVLARLAKMSQEVFGTQPIIISLPYQKEISDTTTIAGGFNCLLTGDAQTLDRIRAAMARSDSFWVNGVPRQNLMINGYSATPPEVPGVAKESWQRIGPTRVDTAKTILVPSDNWPFLYLRERAIPGLNLRGMAIVAVLSLAILFAFAPVRVARPNGQMFFLGAGFMLLETKGVVHMALLFGSTWVVNSIVFMAVLLMILLSNLFVIAARPRRQWPFYVGLVAALLVNTFVPMHYFLSLPGAARLVVSCGVTFVPIFFAGIIFATAFRCSQSPDVDFGSNVAGAILGGLSENIALALGYEWLMLVAIGFYLLSAVLRPRGQLAPTGAVA